MKDKCLALLLAAMLAGCGPGEQPQPGDNPGQPALELLSSAQSSLVFPAEGSDIKLMFSASAPWTAQVLTNIPGQWCTVTPDQGDAGSAVTVTVHTEGNTDGEDRTASVILLCGSTKVNVSVNQKSRNALTVTQGTFDFGPEGGTFTIEAKSNVELTWEIDPGCKDWILPGTTRAMTTSYLPFSVAENEGDRRSGSVTVKAGDLTETIRVNQEACRPTVVLGEAKLEVKAEAGEASIPLKTNVPVTVEIPKGVTWIHYVRTRALENKEVILSFDDNDTGEPREATVYIVNAENGIRQAVSVQQGFKPFAESEEFYTVGPEGGTIEIKLSTNLDNYRVVIPSDASSWLSHVSTRAVRTDILTFSVQPTDLYLARQAAVSIVDAEGTTRLQFTIKQNAKAIPNNEIWYTTKYGYTIEPKTTGFNCNLRENVYADGHGRLIFDDDVLTVGSEAFSGQTSLIGVTLPNSVKTIRSSAFSGCTSMTDIYLSSSLTTVESGVFNNCTGTLHFNGEKLPDNCCVNAKSITGAEFGEKVEKLGAYAFDGCTALASVNVPESLKEIGQYCFRNCTSLTAFSPANHSISIGQYAFNASGIKEFTWYAPGMKVGSYAFLNSKLEKVTFVESDGTYSYSIATGVFEGTLLKQVTLGSHLTSIGDRVFYNCKISQMTAPRQTPPSVGQNVFNYYSTQLTVPEGCELTYALSSYWYPYFAAGYIIGFNDFYDFLTTGYDKNYEPYTRFYARPDLKETFPFTLSALGVVADTDQSKLTVDKAAYVKEVPFTDDLKESDSVGNIVIPDSYHYCYRPTFVGLGKKTLYFKAFARFVGRDEVWYSHVSSVYRSSFNTPAREGAANCYLVKPGEYFAIDLCYGPSAIAVDAVDAQVIWESGGTATAVSAGSVVAKATFNDWAGKRDLNSIIVQAGSKEGNAVVAALDKYGDILWSWHVWVTSTALNDMKQAYRNVPSFIMDRNLGALSATPGDAKSLGLTYQWGRKDPFPAPGHADTGAVTDLALTVSTGTVSYAVHHPATGLVKNPKSDDWVYNAAIEPERWSSKKGFFDPCPAGWRLPEGGPDGVWAQASRNRTGKYSWNASLGGSDMQEVFLTEGNCWYPSLDIYGQEFYLWGCNTTTVSGALAPYCFWGTRTNCNPSYSLSQPSRMFSVRCITEGAVNGSHEGSEEEDWGL